MNANTITIIVLSHLAGLIVGVCIAYIWQHRKGSGT